MTGIDPNLKPVQTGDFQIGLDHELSRTMSIGFRYIHKWAARTMEDVGIYAPDLGSDPSGQTLVEDYLIANPGEGYAVIMEPRFPGLPEGKTKRDYEGAAKVAEKLRAEAEPESAAEKRLQALIREMEQFDDQEDDEFGDAAGEIYGGPLRRWSDDAADPE